MSYQEELQKDHSAGLHAERPHPACPVCLLMLDSFRIIEHLQTELGLRDEQIEDLEEQIKDLEYDLRAECEEEDDE